MDKYFKPENFFQTACLFESSLIIIAIVLGWVTRINPFAYLSFSEKDFVFGIWATLPMILSFFILQNLPIKQIKDIQDLLFETLGSRLFQNHWTDLFILAAIAGFAEEVLFRGFLQPWLEETTSISIGLVISNLIFGLVHAVTPLYGLLAFLIGLYLGSYLDYEGERKLIIPIIMHGLYDFVVFLVILRKYQTWLNK